MSDYADNPVAVELQTDDIGARFAISELKKVYTRIDNTQVYKSNYGESVVAVHLYFQHFSDYCRDMMLYRSKHGVYPNLNQLVSFDEYTFQERVELIRTKMVSNENFLYLCKPIVEAIHTISVCDRGSARFTFDEIVEILTEMIPPNMTEDECDDFLHWLCPSEFVRGFDLDALFYLEDNSVERNVQEQHVHTIVSSDRSSFLKASFQALEYEPELTSNDPDEVLLIALTTPREEFKYQSDYLSPLPSSKPRPRSVVSPPDVLNPGDVDYLFDIQLLDEPVKRQLLASKYVARMWDLERRIQKPRVAFTQSRSDYRFGKNVILCRAGGVSSNPRTIVLSSTDPISELEWRMRRKKMRWKLAQGVGS